MPYVLAQSTLSGLVTPPSGLCTDGSRLPSTKPAQLRRSPSQTHLARPFDLTGFPLFDSAPDGDASSSGSTAVPFPKLPGRRKRVRGVGTQPWHHTGSSDSEEDSSLSSSSTSSPTLLPALPIAPPPPRQAVVRSTPVLKLDLTRRTLSESQIGNSTTSSVGFAALSSTTTPIYRKNGTPVKSSLKSSRNSPSESSSRRPSLPNTPSMEKIVHFDAQLEQIMFFNKDHKPSVISRGGSPEDTEEDSEFFSSGPDQQLARRKFYPGSSEEEKIRQTLVLEQINIPLRNALAQPNEVLGSNDVKLEKIGLSADAKLIEGAIIVRNIAFEKWISVRFTFDRWQTTSEVTARYSESIPEYNLDRFEYSIRVPDVTNKIEEKRLYVAIRYTTAGREIWDNNNGQNYQLRFKRIATPEKEEKSSAGKSQASSWPVKSANVDQMADLRRKLEQVKREDEDEQGTRAWESLTVKLRARNMHIEEEREKVPPLSLRERYDFQESSKVKWTAPQDLPKVNVPASAAGIPFPSSSSSAASTQRARSLPSKNPRGSPRDLDLEHSPKFFIDPHEGDSWHQHQPHQRSHSHSPNATRGRHHQRGYFDAWFEDAAAQGLRLTPPSGLPALAPTASAATAPTSAVRGAPEEIVSETESNSSVASVSSSSTSIAEDMGLSFGGDRSGVRYNSFPMDRSHLSTAATAAAPDTHPTPQAWTVSPPGSSASFSSTPSATSASTPSQCPSSPSESMLDASAEGRFGASTLENLDYNYFLSRFCYFTGSEAPENRVGHHRQSASDSNIHRGSASGLPRRHSVTSSQPWVDGQSANREDELELNGTLSGHTTPTRSPKLSSNSTGFPEKEKGMITPRAGSPLLGAQADVERTPRPASFDFIRPFRGSL